MTALLPLAVLAPVLSALVAVVLPRDRQPWPGLIGALVSAAAALAVVVSVSSQGVLRHELAGWSAPLGIALRADGLSAAFLGLSAIVCAAVAAVATTEPSVTGRRVGFWSLMPLMWAGLNGLFLAADMFNAYVALEVLGLAAVGLVALGGRGAPRAALDYLFVAVIGSMLLLIAIGLIYASTSTLDMDLAGARLGPDGSRLPLALLAAGMALKTALVPVHGWLPPAHAGAPPAVSPLMSALVLKGSFFLLLRMWLDVLHPDAAAGLLLGMLGAVAVMWGGLVALRQRHLKRVVAYSTVAQVGYLFLAFPLLHQPGHRETAVAAVVVMALAHGLAKAAMFLAAGALMLGAGTDEIPRLVGAARSQGVLAVGMILASMSLIGLPLSLGFAAKWGYLASAIGTGQWWVLGVLIAGSLLSIGYLLRPLAAMMRDSDLSQEVGAVELSPRPALQRWMPLALGAAAVFSALLADPLVELILIGRGES